MTSARKLAACSAGFALLFGAGFAPDASLGLSIVTDAQAVVGAPLTPVSAAGVARRTTRRVVAAESSAQAAAAAAPAGAPAAAAPASAAAPAAAPAAAGALPLGTKVSTLPPDCSTMTKDGVEYHKCGPDYYRTAFQGTELVYVTAQP